MIYADLHFHTQYSPDASTQPKMIVERLSAHPTIKAIAVTDHNTFEGYFKVHDLARAYRDLVIIPGVEISSDEGEILLLGTTQMPPQPWKSQDVVEFAESCGAIAIAPHPFRGLGLAENARNLKLSAIETLNAITSPVQNQRAQKLAREMHLPEVAGNDVHALGDLWNVYTEIQAESSVDSILDAIRRGKCRTASTYRSIHF